MAEPTCASCAGPIVGRSRAARYCSGRCKMVANNATKVAEGRTRKVLEKKCGRCTKAIRSDATTCKPCYRILKSESAKRTSRRCRVMAKLRRAAGGTPANARWPWTQGTCIGCGESFTRKGCASPYCGVECRPDRGKKRKWIKDSARRTIYERDEWICQLCHDPVDGSLHYLDDWAPSLDHIVCRSWGEPDHSPQNLRLAHRWCNSVRGDESYYTAADLVAA